MAARRARNQLGRETVADGRTVVETIITTRSWQGRWEEWQILEAAGLFDVEVLTAMPLQAFRSHPVA